MESTQRYRAKPFSDVKGEQEQHKMEQFTRNIDRAVSLPLERKTYMHNCLPEEKERGFSMQRDQVVIFMILCKRFSGATDLCINDYFRI